MKPKLLLLMIDALSADYYRTGFARLPHMHALEQRGFRIDALHAEVLGTSLPGRTSIVTGVTSDVSGVYANKIYDSAQKRFRYANPDDVRVPTLPSVASRAGQTVANVGLGMIRPEDTAIFISPWWAAAFVQRARDSAPEKADASWLRVAMHESGEMFRAMCHRAGLPADLPKLDVSRESERQLYGIIGDHAMFDWAGTLAADRESPDLVCAEFLVTDTIQHHAGYKSALAHWAVEQADLAVGKVLARLRAAGVEEQWNIAVMSDHGHSAIDHALHPRVIIPGTTFQCEGQILLVAVDRDSVATDVAARLAEHGVEPFPDTCIPPDSRGPVRLFVAPDGYSFEDSAESITEPVGKPGSISSHGLRPGRPGDDRLALFAGPAVPHGMIPEADAAQVMPTLAKLLGLPIEGFAEPVF